MGELDDFLARTLAEHVKAVDAAHNGDPTPYLELWSTRDPVTLFGAMASGQGGRDQVTRTIRAAASRFTKGTPLNLELVAAEVSGELAYTVGADLQVLGAGAPARSASGTPPDAGAPPESARRSRRATVGHRQDRGPWRVPKHFFRSFTN
jgi:ketosteroid isomerase-like protein